MTSLFLLAFAAPAALQDAAEPPPPPQTQAPPQAWPADRLTAYLRGVGLVTCRKEGAWCHYRLSRPDGPVHRRLLATLDACGDTVPALAADADRLRRAGCCGGDADDCC